MMEKLLLASTIEEASGEITDEQDLIWKATDLAVRDKLDSYGYLFAELDAEKKKLDFIKTNGVEKLQSAISRVESLSKKLKLRLNTLSNGEALRGHIYSFHPFISTTSYIEDVEKLSPNETYLTIEIRQDYWDALLSDKQYDTKISFDIKKRAGKVSELQDKHPAVKTVLTPSVRVR